MFLSLEQSYYFFFSPMVTNLYIIVFLCTLDLVLNLLFVCSGTQAIEVVLFLFFFLFLIFVFVFCFNVGMSSCSFGGDQDCS